MKELLKIILYKPLYNILIFLTWLIPGHNIGWAIIALTVLVRLALMPSSAKATNAQKDMKRLAPELAEIKKIFKGDRQGEATATMELYKKHGVSPWGSCLPLLIQLPILWVLYKVFMVGLNTDRFDLLYKFTPSPDYINTVWLGINLAQPDKWILPILAGLAQLWQSWQMKQMNPQPKADPANKDKATDFSQALTGQMMYIMPVFTVIIAMRLPAALALYWLITTLFMVLQTWWIMRDKDNSKIKNQNAKLQIKSQNEEIKPKEIKEEVSKVETVDEPKAKRGGIMDRLANRAARYKPRKDVTVEIRRKD